MQYTVLFEDEIYELRASVNQALQEGWRPQGGVFVVWHDAETRIYYQALVRDVPSEAK